MPLTLFHKKSKGPPARSNIRTSHNTLGQSDQPVYPISEIPGNPPPEEASGYLATSSTMARSIIRAGARTANLQEEEAGTPRQGREPGGQDRLQGQVGMRPKAARKEPRPVGGQKGWQEYQGMRSHPSGRTDTAPSGVETSGPSSDASLNRKGEPHVINNGQSGAAVPATPNGRVPWLTKDYIRDNASVYQWGWPAFNTNAVVIHPLRFIYARYRGGAPARGLKSVSGVLAQEGSGEASRIHIPAIFIPQP